MEPRRRGGLALMVTGAFLAVGGLIGSVLDDGDETDDVEDEVTALATTSTTTAAAPTTAPTTTNTDQASAVAVEDPVAFVAEVLVAISDQDVEFLVDRVSDATIERYGFDQCRDYFTTVPDLAGGFEATAAGAAKASWEYTTDGRSSTIDDAIPVTIERERDGFEQELHVVMDEDGRFRFFGDCGEPIEETS